MVIIYPVFTAGLDDVIKVFEKYPPEFTAAFGFNLSSIFSYEGYYIFTFNYLALLSAIMAVAISTTTFSREKRSKCLDFIFTKPIKRETIFLLKLCADFIVILITNIIFIIAGMFFYYQEQNHTTDARTFFYALLAIFLTQLVFQCIGTFVAVFLKKIRSVSGLATSIGICAFVLSALVNILQEDSLKLISPLKYWDPQTLLSNGHFDINYALVALLLSVLCLFFAYIKYSRSDIHAV
jgi:ABC-2 type transport system permease protein